MFPQGYTLQMGGAVNYVDLKDGYFNIGADTGEAGIQRLFEGLLGRPGDPGSLAAYVADGQAGVSRATMAAGFLSSTEYVAEHGVTTNAQFVTSLFEGFLGRAPDPASGASLTAQLDSGAITRAAAVVSIDNSLEAQINLGADTDGFFVPNPEGIAINDAYNTALGRDVDLGTETNIGAALKAGTPLLSIIQGVIASPEFLADHAGQGNAALVASLYENGLGRAPDPVSGGADVAYLNAGGSLAQIVLNISGSPEAVAHLTQASPGAPV